MSTSPVVVYVRYSPRPKLRNESLEASAAQEDAETIKLQIEACERYAAMKSLVITDIIRDPETSARKTPLFEREGGENLKSLPRGSHIICYKLDRMFRNTVDGLTTLEYFKERGIRLHFADQGGCTIDVSTAVGEMLTTTLLAYAAFEPRQTSERTAAAYKHLAKRGIVLTSRDCIQYGRRFDETIGQNVEDEKECNMIRLARKLNAEGLSLPAIGKRLIEEFGDLRGLKQIHSQKVKNLIRSKSVD